MRGEGPFASLPVASGCLVRCDGCVTKNDTDERGLVFGEIRKITRVSVIPGSPVNVCLTFPSTKWGCWTPCQRKARSVMSRRVYITSGKKGVREMRIRPTGGFSPVHYLSPNAFVWTALLSSSPRMSRFPIPQSERKAPSFLSLSPGTQRVKRAFVPNTAVKRANRALRQLGTAENQNTIKKLGLMRRSSLLAVDRLLGVGNLVRPIAAAGITLNKLNITL
eukprot:1382536-Amorphochlora_amoeboformis.AAC.1